MEAIQFDAEAYAEKLQDFEKAKNDVRMRLVNKEWDKDFLEDKPHIDCKDLAMTFYIEVGKQDGNAYIISIDNDIMEMWDRSELDVLDYAMDNNRRLFPQAYSMTDFARKQLTEEAFELFTENTKNSPARDMYILTNAHHFYGSSYLMDNEIMTEIAKKLNNDLIIVPVNVDDVILFPATEFMLEQDFDTIIKDFNSNPNSEKLSDSIYYYDAKTQSLEYLADKLKDRSFDEIADDERDDI